MAAVKKLVKGIVGTAGIVLLWSLIEPYLIDQQEYQVKIPNLPTNWEGQRIALIADLQVGMWLGNTGTIRRMVRRLLEQRPAAVMIAGDFVYHASRNQAASISRIRDLLRPLPAAGLPTFAVLGNHDYGMPTKADVKHQALAADIVQALQETGIRVLDNEAVELPSPRPGGRGEPLYLVGLGAHTPGEDKPDVAFAHVPPGAPRLVMMHHPNSFEALAPGTAPLAVAGHTHGGQFHIPFLPDQSLLTYKHEDRIHTDGWVTGYGKTGNRLYVNRGIGFSVVPLRFNCPPELTLFVLRTEK